MDSKQLYQEVILDHNKKPRNWGQLPDASHRAEGVNPLCGDHIWITLKIDGSNIADLAFEGESCAICKASASMMTANVKGKSVEHAERLVQQARHRPPAESARTSRGVRGRQGSAVAREVRDPALAYVARCISQRAEHVDRRRSGPDGVARRQADGPMTARFPSSMPPDRVRAHAQNR
jgi:SUF system NifU family Fe-S assembly protein